MNTLKSIASILLFVPFGASSQDIILQEKFSDGLPATWTVVNEDGLTPSAVVSEFTAAWIPYIYGMDTCVASTSYYETEGTAADFLITPKISLGNYSKINWTARSVDASYPDGYVVLISTTDSLVASFTDTLMTVNTEPNYFVTRGVELDLAGYVNQDVYIAFKNNTESGFILLLDQVTVLGAETASIEDPTNSIITIYPNPTVDYITIQSTSEIQLIQVYSLNGTLLLTSQENVISLANLATGSYVLQVNSENGILRQLVSKTN
jgi:hypothetical protein